jgi:hypothetical protein
MNEDVLGEMVLNAQGETIEEGIVPIPLTYIYIVCCEDNSLPQQLVIKGEQRSVEKLELIVP